MQRWQQQHPQEQQHADTSLSSSSALTSTDLSRFDALDPYQLSSFFTDFTGDYVEPTSFPDSFVFSTATADPVLYQPALEPALLRFDPVESEELHSTFLLPDSQDMISSHSVSSTSHSTHDLSGFRTQSLPGRKRKTTASPGSPDNDELALKRHRNNIAAKKYRQKKVDRIEELEEEVRRVTQEKDELRLQLAKRDAEVQMVRDLLQRQK